MKLTRRQFSTALAEPGRSRRHRCFREARGYDLMATNTMDEPKIARATGIFELDQ